mmetsp:Transcript_11671/g.28326  ORF Transcript_11671/g.28326 Transcript_11671/m.28326 type:complete len:452 (+) Transcript_11671:119-1474(+)
MLMLLWLWIFLYSSSNNHGGTVVAYIFVAAPSRNRESIVVWAAAGPRSNDECDESDTPLPQQQRRRQVLLRSTSILTTAIPWEAPADTTTTTISASLPPAADVEVTLPMMADDSRETITIPLQWVPRLSAYVVLYSVGGAERFAAIVDTGSPFLVVPHYCNRQTYGCFDPSQSRASGLAPTVERFDNNQGMVEWRVAPFSFVNAQGSMMGPPEMIFGVLSESLMDGPGGVFLGLIRDTDSWIRPSFLGQTNVQAMKLGLKRTSDGGNNRDGKTLTLYTQSPLQLNNNNNNNDPNVISLTRDLNRKYGAPVIHYTIRATEFRANGNNVLQQQLEHEQQKSNTKRKQQQQLPIYVILDTGVTGMVVSQELWDWRYAAARRNKEKSLWGHVSLELRTDQGQVVELSAQNPVTTPLGSAPWPKFRNKGHLVVAGLAFLDGHDILIDMEQQKVQIA